MKAKLLSFLFISFSESGLFNGIWPIQIKRSCFCPVLLKDHKWRVSLCLLGSGRGDRVDPVGRNRFTTDSGFPQDILQISGEDLTVGLCQRAVMSDGPRTG